MSYVNRAFLDKQINVDGSCLRAGFECLTWGGITKKDVSSHHRDSRVLAQNVTQAPVAFERTVVHDGKIDLHLFRIFFKLRWSEAARLILVSEEKPVSIHQFFELHCFDAVEGGTSQSASDWGLSLPEGQDAAMHIGDSSSERYLWSPGLQHRGQYHQVLSREFSARSTDPQ